jgi:Holliday junction DNA helicase RuvB
MKSEDLEVLRHLAEFEESEAGRKWLATIGWPWRAARVWPAVLNRLVVEGCLEVVFSSNSHTGYRLTDKGKALAGGGPEVAPGQGLRQAQDVALGTAEPQTGPVALPDDLFDDIIGHDDVKELLKAALQAERPVHVLLCGPPALAKSLFLWGLERAGGEAALWLVGSATSRAGLWDLVAEKRPRWLLVDEIEKMSAADTAGLLSLMEGGRLVRAKVGRGLDSAVPLWVVAATNAAHRLSPELRSRFALRRLHPYGREEFRTVVQGVLVRREGVSPEVAGEIALRLDGRSQDVRDAIRVARLAPQVGVERAVELLLG